MGEIIKSYWGGDQHCYKTFSQKIQHVTKELAARSKNKFSNASLQIRSLKQKLTEITNGNFEFSSRVDSQEIKENIERL